MEGIIVINKPQGLTSHDVVDRIRRKFKMKRVGHAGTLDPLATGVLVILLGRSTKLFETFLKYDKAYRATLILGTSTDSADTQGKILAQNPYDHITQDQVEAVFKRFTGTIQQVPPMVSAVKVKGKKLYQLARKGIVIEREPREVTIKTLALDAWDSPNVRFSLSCTKGTYVRQLAADVGEALGCGACISQIERTRVGELNIDDAVTLEEVDERHIRSWSA